jgi:hypothetical protein
MKRYVQRQVENSKHPVVLGLCIVGIVVMECVNMCVLHHDGTILVGCVGTIAAIAGVGGGIVYGRRTGNKSKE